MSCSSLGLHPVYYQAQHHLSPLHSTLSSLCCFHLQDDTTLQPLRRYFTTTGARELSQPAQVIGVDVTEPATELVWRNRASKSSLRTCLAASNNLTVIPQVPTLTLLRPRLGFTPPCPIPTSDRDRFLPLRSRLRQTLDEPIYYW